VLVDDRKLEAPALEPLQVQHKAVAVPEEDLHLVLRLAHEDEAFFNASSTSARSPSIPLRMSTSAAAK
jgi:hypothetical protein